MTKNTFFFFLFLLASGVASASEFSSRLQYWASPRDVAPLVFEDGDGVQHALSEFRGRFVLLNVWATWCPPCVYEMPSFEKLQQRFDPSVLFVLPLSEDYEPEKAEAFYRSHRLSHLPLASDSTGRALSVFSLKGLPTTLLIDPQGREVARLHGIFDWNSEEAVSFLRSHIDRYKR